MISFVV